MNNEEIIAKQKTEIETLQQEIINLKKVMSKERKLSIGFVSQLFRRNGGYTSEFNEKIRAILEKISTEKPLSEQVDEIFELQRFLQEQSKIVKKVNETVDNVSSEIINLTERYPNLKEKLISDHLEIDTISQTGNAEKIVTCLNICINALFYFENVIKTSTSNALPQQYRDELIGLVSSIIPSNNHEKEILTNCIQLLDGNPRYADLEYIVTNAIRTVSNKSSRELEDSVFFLSNLFEHINKIQESVSNKISKGLDLNKASSSNQKWLNEEIVNLNKIITDLEITDIPEEVNKKLEQLGNLVKTNGNLIDMQSKFITELNHIEKMVNTVKQNSTSYVNDIKDMSKKNAIDALTGLNNSISLHRYLDHEISTYITAEKTTPFYVLLIDIDKFTEFNKKYNTSVGDKILKVIALTIRQNLRKTDYVARVVADHFAIILHENKDEEVSAIANKLINAIKTIPFHYHTEKVQVSLTAIAMKINNPTTSEKILLGLEQYAKALKNVEQKPGFQIIESK